VTLFFASILHEPHYWGKLSNAYQLGFAGKLLKSSTVSIPIFSIIKNRQVLHRKARMRFFGQSFQPPSYLYHHIPPRRNHTVPYVTKLQPFCICLQAKEIFGHPSFCL
jgi:hypothetical protein